MGTLTKGAIDMSFEIKIVETREIKKVVGGDWVITGQVQKRSEYTDDLYLSDERGYSPEIEKTVVEKIERLSQVVDDLDVQAVIRAINGLG